MTRLSQSGQIVLCLVSLLVLISLAQATAAVRCEPPYETPTVCIPPWRRVCGCPDDYQPKQLPCQPPVNCRLCGDYCRKLLPLPPAPCCAQGCDDYVPKCGPIPIQTTTPPWWRCAPNECRK